MNSPRYLVESKSSFSWSFSSLPTQETTQENVWHWSHSIWLAIDYVLKSDIFVSVFCFRSEYGYISLHWIFISWFISGSEGMTVSFWSGNTSFPDVYLQYILWADLNGDPPDTESSKVEHSFLRCGILVLSSVSYCFLLCLFPTC